ncbi:hypothetical protein ABBQ32_006308 [Trebouxia sp. C0010 RCD-2024]
MASGYLLFLWGWGSPDVSMSHPYVVLSWPPQLQLTAQPSGSLVQGWAQIWPRAEGLERACTWAVLQLWLGLGLMPGDPPFPCICSAFHVQHAYDCS